MTLNAEAAVELAARPGQIGSAPGQIGRAPGQSSFGSKHSSAFVHPKQLAKSMSVHVIVKAEA